MNDSVTIVNGTSPSETLKCLSIEDLSKIIKEEKYGEALEEYRLSYRQDVIEIDKDVENKRSLFICKKVPSVRFSGLFRKQRGKQELVERNLLILLEVENLFDFQHAEKVREMAARHPRTLLTFIGADGHSVRIVCGVRKLDGSLPSDEKEWRKVITKAYDKACSFYADFLGVSITKRTPDADRSCLVSADRGCFYYANADPWLVDLNREVEESYDWPTVGRSDKQSLIYGLSEIEAQRKIYHACLRKALIEASISEGKGDKATEGMDRDLKALYLLANLCHESGLPLMMCAELCQFQPCFHKYKKEITDVFDSVYIGDFCNELSTKHVDKPTLSSYMFDYFVRRRYQLRKNELSGTTLYKEDHSHAGDWAPVTTEVRNTMTIKAREFGLDAWDKDVDRYINSNLIPLYNPIDEFLYTVEKWDGKEDYVGEVAKRVKTNNPDWVHDFHVWMLGMVAHWMKRDGLHGNAALPLLIGRQGTGKTSFCRILLPPELRSYYTDNLNIKDEKTIKAAMSGYALINIDEFDNISKSKQPLLKMLLSTSTVDGREMYTSSMTRKHRYASFIGSTNNLHPILDYTGSRRFVCALVEEPIDFTTPIDYKRLYGQLVAELESGARYYFNDADNKRIMAYNERFRNLSDLGEMIISLFRVLDEGEKGELLSVQQIAEKLKASFTNYSQAKNSNIELGRKLTSLGFKRTIRKDGSYYQVIYLG